MKKITQIKSTALVLDIDNIDTDQIIASDHLTITDKKGLGEFLFSGWRYLANGEDNGEFVLNQSNANQARILIAGDNFGCGSSREHAPWALLDYGIDIVISTSIADIFFNNAIKNGLLPIKVSQQQHRYLLSQNLMPIEVDLMSQKIKCQDKVFNFELEPFARFCLINGIDQLDFLQSHLLDIESYEKKIIKQNRCQYEL